MERSYATTRSLTDSGIWRGVFLTLITIFVLIPFHSPRADDYGRDPALFDNRITTIFGKPAYSPFADQDQHHRVSLLLDYVRKEGPALAPGLPSALRDPAQWMSNRLGLDSLNGGGDDDTIMASIFRPVSSLLQAPSQEEAQALWLSPAYHHKGMLPFNDALVLGINARHRMWDDRLQLDLHPFYGQNWLRADGYFGAEAAINISRTADGVRAKPWGRIALSYTGGNSTLMDHGHGFGLHSEVNFNDNLSLNAGMHENETTDIGNYVLLRWKLSLD